MARGRSSRKKPAAERRPAAAERGAASARRHGHQRRSKWQPLGLRLALLAGLVVGVLFIANGTGLLRSSAGVVTADLGRGHVAEGTAITYDSIPPTSGSHYAAKVAPWGSYTARIEDPIVVHNLEHGGIAVAYDGVDEVTVKQLEGLLTKLPASRYGNRVKLVIHPDDRLSAGQIVLTAWTRIDRLDSYDEGRIRKFYEANLDQCCEKVP